MQQQVVAHTTAYKALLDTRKGIHGMIYFEKSGMVSVEVGAYFRVDARRSFAILAYSLVAPRHTIHIGRRASKIGKIAFEVRHIYHLARFFQYTFL